MWSLVRKGCCVLSVLVGLHHPLHAEPDFGGAQAAFNSLSKQDQTAIAMSLIATGYYNGIVDSFNRRIFSGISSFQRANGFPPTGVLSNAQRDVLASMASNYLATIGLGEVKHPQIRASVYVPLKLVLPARPTGRGFAFEGDDVSVDFSAFRSTDRSLSSLFSTLSAKTPSRIVTYKVLRDQFFVVSGRIEAGGFYTRYAAAGTSVVGFTLTWKDSLQNADRLAVLMSNLFFPEGSSQSGELQASNVQNSGSLKASPGEAWLVIASRPDLADAIAIARKVELRSIRIMRSVNGVYAVVDGPYQKEEAERRRQLIGGDVYLSNGERFAALAWSPLAEPTSVTVPPVVPKVEEKKNATSDSSGSGFYISNSGHMLTNHHVVDGCKVLKIPNVGKVEVVAVDKGNDLALLKITPPPVVKPLKMRTRSLRLGEEVVALGYPLQGLLGGLNVTTGMISAMSGLSNDTTRVQFTAAIQPGNSGGALLDRAGAVAGVVSAKLSDTATLKYAGFVAQSVNFAIRKDVAAAFVEAQGVIVDYSTDDAQPSVADLVERSRAAVVPIECFN